jgi:integrase
MARYKLTEAFIKEKVADASEAGRHRVFYDDNKDSPRGFGVRVTKAGAVSFVLNYYAGGSERRATVNKPGEHLSITAARKRAQVMRDRVNAKGDPLAEAQAVRAAKQASKAEAKRKLEYGLGALMAAYVEHLKAAGKPSWKQVDGAIARHITEPLPKLAAKPADEITVDDVMPVFHDLAKAGKLREAEKLRAYLRAAYTAARKARTDAAMFAFTGFQIRANPLLDLDVSRPKEAADKAAAAAKERKWALSEAQLAAYWRHIESDETSRGALLRFHLLTGGQRVEQLSRLTAADYDTERKTITLHDTKGRRKVAYEHVVPLLPEAVKALDSMRGDKGDHLFTVTAGRDGAVYHTVWEAVQEVAATMIEAKEIDRVFTPGTLRKTVETRLQAAGVSKEVRAHLLSHGRSGVQAQHYEAHDYDTEKRAALRKLRTLSEAKGKNGNVTPIRRKA